MNRTYGIRVLHSIFFLLLGITSLKAQLQFPGKPMDLSGRIKAAQVMYVLPPLDPMELEAVKLANLDRVKKSFVFAMDRPVSLSPESHGTWVEQGEYRIWRVHILSPAAHSMGLVFNEYALQPGVKVFVYDPDQKQVKGAFTSGNNKTSGILPVGHIEGDELVIEMQVPWDVTHYGALGIESVSHAFLDIRQLSNRPNCSPGEFGCSHACEIDINCTEGDAWQLTKRSVVRILARNQYCTGVLINNTAYDATPYLLTAEHCINSEYTADRSIFLFNYESSACFGENGPLDMSISACDTLAVGDSLDFSLIQLSSVPPDSFDVYYAGWDRSDFQTSPSTVIHHPWGDVKKVSKDFEAPSTPTQPGDVPYTDLDDYHYWSYWWIREWDIGTTEGGSSGSPLFNEGRRVIGLLSGGIARCGDSIGYNSETDRVIYNQALNYDDYFTRIGAAWDPDGEESSLKPWLDPLNTGEMQIGGYHPTDTGPPIPEEGSGFTLFPNPVSEQLNISYPFVPERVDYHIYDLSGSMQLSGFLDGTGWNRINISTLVPGVYLIRLETSELKENHKIVVNR